MASIKARMAVRFVMSQCFVEMLLKQSGACRFARSVSTFVCPSRHCSNDRPKMKQFLKLPALADSPPRMEVGRKSRWRWRRAHLLPGLVLANVGRWNSSPRCGQTASGAEFTGVDASAQRERGPLPRDRNIRLSKPVPAWS
jgi:hypothetical protein